jgi:membrane protease subunit HflK
MNWDWDKLKEQQHRQDRGSGGAPPQMDEILSNLKKFKFPIKGFGLIIILIIGALVYSMVYTVAQDEVGVVQRFGKYARTEQPGLNVKLPMGIEKVTKVNIQQVNTAEFGFRTTRGMSSENTNVSLMLTGDLNVAVVPWIVQYKVKDPFQYLFKVRDVNRLLIDMSEAAMRLVVGDRSINEVITKRREIADESKGILQKELDGAEAGLLVVTVEMKKTNVPPPVQPSFNEVNQSLQEKEQMIYKAREDYNKAIPAARGQAERTVKAAEGYALDRVNRSKGDAARFTAVYEEYAKARDVTKRRLYLETLRDLFPKLGDKYIVDSDQKNLLPLLNLGNKNKVNEVVK